MALTLYVETARWKAMVDEMWAAFPGLIPVVKGNGYGLGRSWLAHEAHSRGAQEIAVGTIYEVAHIAPVPVRPIVLTPSFDLDSTSVPEHVVLTVGSLAQVEHLLQHRPRGPVVVKLATAMHRHGLAPYEVGRVLRSLANAGVPVHSAAIHSGLANSDDERRKEVESLLTAVPIEMLVTVSHLGREEFALLKSRYPQRRFGIRLGSSLWHGDKGALALRTKVLDVRPVIAGSRVGYWSTLVPGDGTVIVVSGGSVHGMAALPDGSSPFHYAKRRLALIERPHMHVSMAFVPNGDPCPVPGEEVEVQRPLVSTNVDRIVWR